MSNIYTIELMGVYSFVDPEINRHTISIQYKGKMSQKPHFNQEEISEIRRCTREEIEQLDFAMNCKKRLQDFFVAI